MIKGSLFIRYKSSKSSSLISRSINLSVSRIFIGNLYDALQAGHMLSLAFEADVFAENQFVAIIIKY